MASSFPAEVAQKIDIGSDVQPYTPSQVAGEVFVPGDLVFYDTVNFWMERCGADPALIAGISEVDSEEARVLTEDGKIPVRLLDTSAIVRMASATTPAEAHVGVAYGIVRDANGHWLVDTADVVNTRVTVVGIDIATGSFYVKFIAANLQFDGIAS